MKSGDADADYVNNSKVLTETPYYKSKRGSNGIFAYGDKSLVKLIGENNIVKSEISEKSKALMGDFAISAFIHGKTRKSNCLRRATISYKAEFGAYTPTTPQFPSRGKIM